MLRLERVTKRFGAVTAVDEVSLAVEAGEFITMLGPSGCGKTTTLRIIAGFETADAGRLTLADRDITRVPPQDRGIGMVFQNYALFPHMSVFDNVAFGLRTRRMSKDEIKRRVGAALDLVDLSDFAHRKIQQLSGGQQQRVALARALAPEPPLILLDEPLSNLDAALRERTRNELRQLLKRVNMTAIFVTHDQEEAFALSDRVVLMHAGRVQQIGAPEELYRNPANVQVATFLGRGANAPCTIVAASGTTAVCEVQPGVRWRARVLDGVNAAAGSRATLLVRPDAVTLVGTPPDTGTPGDVARVTVLDVRFAGAFSAYHVRLGDTELFVNGAAGIAQPSEDVGLAPRTPNSVFVIS